MRFSTGLRLSVLWAFALGSGFGQTLIDARTQVKNVDFSGANATKPFQTGSSLPATCTVGQMYFKSNAPSGANMYGCTATNTWTPQSSQSGGGASMATQLGDLSVAAQSASTLAVNSSCTATAPCNVFVGGALYSFTTTSRATISGTSGAGTATVYVSDTGALTLEYPSGIAGLSVACTGCTAISTATPGTPPDAVPVAQIAFSTTAGATSWGTITDRRAFLSAGGGSSTTTSLSAGPGGGVVVNCTSGNCGASLDTSFAAIQAGNNNFTGANQFGVGSQGVDFSASNDTVTGTGDKLLAKLTAKGTVIRSAAGDVSGAIGIVLPGTGGLSGTARVRFNGFATCTFDNVATQGDYVQISSTTAGMCHDAGAGKPASGQIIGRVWNTAGASGDNTVILGFDPNAASGVGGSSSTNDHAALIHLDYASSGHTGFQPALGFTPVNAATVGQPNGVASLGSDGKVPAAQLPAAGGGSSAGAYTPAPVQGQVTVWKFSLPAAITVNSISSGFVSGSGFGEYTTFGIYNATCTTLLGQMTPIASSNQFFNQAMQSPVTLPAGTYYMAAVTNGTHNQGYSPLDTSVQLYRFLANAGATPAYATAQNPPSGSGTSVTLPASCGPLTAVTNGSLAWAVRLVN